MGMSAAAVSDSCGGHMDKYGLLERSQHSSGNRKRFLQSYRFSEEARERVPWGEPGATSPLGLQGTLDRLSRPQAAAGVKMILWMTAWER